MKKTVVINILGGPGVGKTTTASELFSLLKRKGFEVENVSEFAKELVWENRSAAFNDRLYMHAEQNHRLIQMNGHLDYIITDSPLILTSIYNHYYLKKAYPTSYNKMIDEVVKQTWSLYNNKVFLLPRVSDYHNLGRRENEKEAKDIDKLINKYLKDNKIKYQQLTSVDDAALEIIKALGIK